MLENGNHGYFCQDRFFNGNCNEETLKLEGLKQKRVDTFTTGLIITEILCGIKDNRMLEEVKEKLLKLPFVNPCNPSTYINSALIYRKGKKKGTTIRKTIDFLIMQPAIENCLYLIHKDYDFNKIATFTELKIYQICNSKLIKVITKNTSTL